MDIIRDKPHISTIATSDRDAFLFGLERISFASYGINEDLSAALAACGKHYATTIQAKAFVAITNGQDVVMGSETGSGKTLAYLVPIINQLLESNDHDHIRQYPRAVVMCPNKELAAQVHRMATEVITGLKDEGRQAVVAGKAILDIWNAYIHGYQITISRCVDLPFFQVCMSNSWTNGPASVTLYCPQASWCVRQHFWPISSKAPIYWNQNSSETSVTLFLTR